MTFMYTIENSIITNTRLVAGGDILIGKYCLNQLPDMSESELIDNLESWNQNKSILVTHFPTNHCVSSETQIECSDSTFTVLLKKNGEATATYHANNKSLTCVVTIDRRAHV